MNQKLISRPYYQNLLLSLQGKNIIKVITGARRSGKSTLMELYQLELKKQGIADDHIISFNLEDEDNAHLTVSTNLHRAVLDQVKDDGQYYVFLDEIQICEQFEKAVDSLFLRKNIDIVITGSNAFMLSGELATRLAGRYITIEVLPLSFKEFRTAVQDEGLSRETDFNRYLQYGTFPALLEYLATPNLIANYYEMLFNSIVVKDIATRHNIRDIRILTKVIRTLCSSIGSAISARNITNTLKTAGYQTSIPTISQYLSALEESYFFYPVQRFDVNGRKLLQSQEKFYLIDPGFRQYLSSSTKADIGHLIENIVYLELRRRYSHVYIGRAADKEIDFVTREGDRFAYFQVSLSILDETTRERELSAFDGIKDNFPKTLLTLDTIGTGMSYNGVEHINLLDWLLADKG